jgi:AcrR family transcriptional regulator
MMAEQNKPSTKDKILRTAAKMFSERGYESVTIREIANSIGINSASLYHHFSSKHDILTSLYQFYSDERSKECPDLDELLRLAESTRPHELLMLTEFHYNEDIREFLDQILITAAREIRSDPISEQFIRENIFGNIARVLNPLLRRLIELGKIKPFDVEAFLSVLSYYCFSSAALHHSPFTQGVDGYRSGMSLLFSCIAPVEKSHEKG